MSVSNITNDAIEMLPYRTLVQNALKLGLPGNLKKVEYVKLLRLHRMGYIFECKRLAQVMKTKKQTVKKCPKKLEKKRSVGRPRKSKIKDEPLSDSSENFEIPHASGIPIEKVQICRTAKPLLKSNSVDQMCSSTSSRNVICEPPPIAKTTCELLRNMLLTTDRTRFNKSKASTNCTTSNNNTYHNYYKYNGSKPLNLEVAHGHNNIKIENSSKIKWNNNGKNSSISMKEVKSTISSNYYQPNLQAFPDIPQLADVDINASFEIDSSNYSINDQTDTDTVVSLYIDDSDTLSNESAENTEQEQRDFDQRWAMSFRIENSEMSIPLVNSETSNQLDDGSLLGPQDTALVQSDVIQNYIETNNVQFMQLPDSGFEVIRTLQYYESRLIANPRSFPEHLQNFNGPIINEQTEQNNQLNLTGSNQTIVEVTNLLPCPIAGCAWYSHSATLYVHLFTCHQEMIFYGNLITHVFRCQDIQNFCFFTHLQYVQNTIFIITVAFDCYSHTYVATIQHVTSYGDNTSNTQITALLATYSLYNNVDQHSWTGPVQPYSVPLDVLHADGKCLFIDPYNTEHVVIKVSLSLSSMYSNDSMFATYL